MQLNKIIRLLKENKPIFGVFSGEKNAAQAANIVRDPRIDFVFYDMETGPFDVPRMQLYIQSMIDRASLVLSDDGTNDFPLVTRIPPIRDGRDTAVERVGRVLDAGACGVIFPHVESSEDAAFAVRTMRYASERDEPAGLRPDTVGDAPRCWGVGEATYRRKADVWPLEPDGELVNIVIIEDRAGVENAYEICATKGVSIVLAGPGDLRRAYAGDMDAVEKAIQTILGASKELDVPCGITAGPDDIEKRLREGFRVLITGAEALAIGRRAAGR
jgi:4-hydroxy-2-oxoheptanedioate aldolase